MLVALTDPTRNLIFIDARKQNRFVETDIDSGDLVSSMKDPLSVVCMRTILSLRRMMGMHGLFIYVSKEMLHYSVPLEETARIIFNDATYSILNSFYHGMNARLFYDGDVCKKIAEKSTADALKNAGCWSHYIASYAHATDKYNPSAAQKKSDAYEALKLKRASRELAKPDIFTET